MKSIAVFCGSSIGASDVYQEDAISLGKELARRGITLIYGGSSIGIMGILANTVLAEGGKVIGVMPQLLNEREISHKQLTELIVVESMHERKAKMAQLADCFLTLPGGAGTMEEFFEVFTWAQIGIHQKPIGLLNSKGYYTPLVSLLNHLVTEQFMAQKYAAMVIVESDIETLFTKFETYEAPEMKSYSDVK